MKRKAILLFCLTTLLISSCLKESLDPLSLKKVFLVSVDYQTFSFEGGKEFSYFDDESTVELPLTKNYANSLPGTDGSLNVLYASDTLFYGTVKWETSGERIFPKSFDFPENYYPLDNPLKMPDTTRFQVVHYDLPGVPIQYDSIWSGISKLRKINDYLLKNPSAKIGMFLHRPREGASISENPGDWTWYLVFKE